ncbi:hypothetical protein D9M71_748370 [compost metagenome]
MLTENDIITRLEEVFENLGHTDVRSENLNNILPGKFEKFVIQVNEKFDGEVTEKLALGDTDKFDTFDDVVDWLKQRSNA